jgi:hypothetical protein
LLDDPLVPGLHSPNLLFVERELLIVNHLVIAPAQNDQVVVFVEYGRQKIGAVSWPVRSTGHDVTLVCDDARIIQLRLFDNKESVTVRAAITA